MSGLQRNNIQYTTIIEQFYRRAYSEDSSEQPPHLHQVHRDCDYNSYTISYHDPTTILYPITILYYTILIILYDGILAYYYAILCYTIIICYGMVWYGMVWYGILYCIIVTILLLYAVSSRSLCLICVYLIHKGLYYILKKNLIHCCFLFYIYFSPLFLPSVNSGVIFFLCFLFRLEARPQVLSFEF